MALAAAAVLGLSVTPAAGATLTVNTTTDETTPGDGLCSLREAVAVVNSPGTPGDCGRADGGANTIALGAHQYNLSIASGGTNDNSTGDLNVVGTVTTLTIAGSGAAATAIDASSLDDRVLSIAAGASVSIRDLTLSHGRTRTALRAAWAPTELLAATAAASRTRDR